MSVKKTELGVSLVEFLISLTILALIAAPIFLTIRVALNVWSEGSTELQSKKELHALLAPMIHQLRYASEINAISPPSEQKGYIQFTNPEGKVINYYYNSAENQGRFLVNNFEENSLAFSSNYDPSTAELLLQNVTRFSLESYTENSSLLHIVSTNNTLDTPLSQINSIKLIAVLTENGKHYKIEQLVDIGHTATEGSGFQEYGTEEQPFSENADSGFVLNNISIKRDEGGSFANHIQLSKPPHTVTIQHSGLYFNSIQEAINHSVAGDIILIAGKEEAYVENIRVPEGVTLRGGYNPKTWQRDLERNPSLIKASDYSTKSEEPTAVLVLSDNSQVDGLTIDGEGLRYAIYSKDNRNIRIMNTTINDCDTAIYLSNSSGEVIQNSVTANQQSLYASDSDTLLIARNRLYSKAIALRNNVHISNSQKLRIANNLILYGYSGLHLESIDQTSIHNNVITRALHTGLYIENSHNSYCFNNIIAENEIGLYADPDTVISIKDNAISYNFFALNSSAHYLNIHLESSNLIHNNITEFNWRNNNPIFQSLENFVLANDSDLIDAGKAGTQDIYLENNPSQGKKDSDIGLFGGPYAGRIGPGKTTRLSLAKNEFEQEAAIRNSYPGDFLILDEGKTDIETTITLKPYQYLGGALPQNSIVEHLSADTLIQAADNTIIERFQVNGNGKNSLLVDKVTGVTIRQLILYNSNNAITLSDTNSAVKFCSVYNSETGIVINNSLSGNISHCIFESLTNGIDNNSGDSITSRYNLFKHVESNYSGPVSSLSDATISGPLLWDPENKVFDLPPSSNARQFEGEHDSGAAPYYNYTGTLTTPILLSNTVRPFTELELKLSNRDSLDTVLSTIAIGFVDGDHSTTLNHVITLNTVIDENTELQSITLPKTIISNTLQLRLGLSSHRINNSPVVDEIKLSWDSW